MGEMISTFYDDEESMVDEFSEQGIDPEYL
jgi:hypothetical protein